MHAAHHLLQLISVVGSLSLTRTTSVSDNVGIGVWTATFAEDFEKGTTKL